MFRVELQLVAELTLSENGALDALPGFSDRLRSHSSVPALLFALQKSRAAAGSDGQIRDLFEARTTQPETESILVLAFSPVHHRTVRRIARRQAGLSDMTLHNRGFLKTFYKTVVPYGGDEGAEARVLITASQE